MPVQVESARSPEQFVCHVWRSPRPLLRRLRVIRVHGRRKRRKIVIGQDPADSPLRLPSRIHLLDEPVHDVVGTEVAVKDPRILVQPLMN